MVWEARALTEFFDVSRQLIKNIDLGLARDMVPVGMSEKTNPAKVKLFQSSVRVPTVTIFDPPVAKHLEHIEEMGKAAGFAAQHFRAIRRDFSALLAHQARSEHAVLFGDRKLVSPESLEYAFLEAAFFNGHIHEINNDSKIHLRDKVVEFTGGGAAEVELPPVPSAEVINLFDRRR